MVFTGAPEAKLNSPTNKFCLYLGQDDEKYKNCIQLYTDFYHEDVFSEFLYVLSVEDQSGNIIFYNPAARFIIRNLQESARSKGICDENLSPLAQSYIKLIGKPVIINKDKYAVKTVVRSRGEEFVYASCGRSIVAARVRPGAVKLDTKAIEKIEAMQAENEQ